MARQIKWDEPISDEDRTWLEQRPDMPAGNGMTNAQRLAANDEEFGGGGKRDNRSTEEKMQELRTTIADAQNELARLEVQLAQENNPNRAVTGNPASGVVVDFTSVDGETPEGAPEPSEDYSDTQYWTVPRLQQEIDSRNAERKAEDLEPISRTGKRAELVERLLKDDREIAGA